MAPYLFGTCCYNFDEDFLGGKEEKETDSITQAFFKDGYAQLKFPVH